MKSPSSADDPHLTTIFGKEERHKAFIPLFEAEKYVQSHNESWSDKQSEDLIVYIRHRPSLGILRTVPPPPYITCCQRKFRSWLWVLNWRIQWLKYNCWWVTIPIIIWRNGLCHILILPGAILASGRSGRETTLWTKQKEFFDKNVLFCALKPI